MAAPGSLACAVTATFLHFASLYYFLPTLPLYVQSLGGSSSDVGLIIAVLALTSLAARPLVGSWMDRTGRRGFLLAGAGIYVLASLGYWAIRSVPGLLLWRMLHGMGLAAFSTAAASLAGDLAPSGRRGTTMGAFGVAQAAALAVGPGIGQFILSTRGYPGLFVAAACTAAASFLCVLVLPSDPPLPPTMPTTAGRHHGRMLWHIAAMPAIVQFAASVAYGTIISFIAVVAQARGLEVVGAFFGLLALSSLSVRLVAGRAYDVWGATTVLTPMLAALSVGMALLAVTGGPLFFLLAAMLAGLGIGGTHTTLITWVVDRSSRENRASSVAAFAACWELGVGGGTIAMARLADAAGFETMFLGVASLPLLGLGGLHWLGDRDRGRAGLN